MDPHQRQSLEASDTPPAGRHLNSEPTSRPKSVVPKIKKRKLTKLKIDAGEQHTGPDQVPGRVQ